MTFWVAFPLARPHFRAVHGQRSKDWNFQGQRDPWRFGWEISPHLSRPFPRFRTLIKPTFSSYYSVSNERIRTTNPQPTPLVTHRGHVGNGCRLISERPFLSQPRARRARKVISPNWEKLLKTSAKTSATSWKEALATNLKNPSPPLSFQCSLASQGHQDTEASQTLPQELYPQLYKGGYAQFLNNYDFRYIRTDEVITPHNRTRRGVSNGLPPKAFVAQHDREPQGRRRNPPPLGSSSQLHHLRLPHPRLQSPGRRRLPLFSHPQQRPRPRLRIRLLSSLQSRPPTSRKEGLFPRRSVGYYSGFIHVDTRGYNATWQG